MEISQETKQFLRDYKDLLKENRITEFLSKLLTSYRSGLSRTDVMQLLENANYPIIDYIDFNKFEPDLENIQFCNTNIVVPETTAQISFGGSNVTSVDFSKCTNMTKLADGAFSDCKNLTQVILPPALTEVSEYCFLNCSNLKEIYLPKTVTELKRDCFIGCDGIIVYISQSNKPHGPTIFSSSLHSFFQDGVGKLKWDTTGRI